MIFITLGSQKFQFNRLLEEVDKLVENLKISNDIFAQTGYSDYIPKNFEYKNFLSREEFQELSNKSDLIITHGGTGAIVGALKKSKRVIAVPRLPKYGEHIDEHQTEIIEEFEKSDLIVGCYDVRDLKEAIDKALNKKIVLYKSNTTTIIDSIDFFINTRN
ncbi:PssE/Cps14G family polysaccharide biosynthesis glycosyltransferase [Streptococcus suis]|uniref:PssE/Cps14G family polysaccharide biosynthesis glycosyltransferase n=1 Tax=Streptococcus suis TaxID=1307 RepID=UPI000C1810D1|nr:PssE/Cps14G family polysaccharide biosynthesis glycosyltransferase [Streptococcus suis]